MFPQVALMLSYHKNPTGRREERENERFVIARNKSYKEWHAAKVNNDNSVSLKAIATKNRIPYSTLHTGYPKYVEYINNNHVNDNNINVVNMNNNNDDGKDESIITYKTSKGGGISLMSPEMISDARQDVYERAKSLNSIVPEQRTVFLQEILFNHNLKESGGDILNMKVENTRPSFSKSAANKYQSMIWDSTKLTKSTDTLRRMEAKIDPYNYINYIAGIRALLRIDTLDLSISQYSEVPPSKIFNFDWSSRFVGESDQHRKVLSSKKAASELNKIGQSERAVRPTRKLICQKRSVGYMPLISGERMLTVTFKVKDKGFSPSLLEHKRYSSWQTVIFVGSKIKDVALARYLLLNIVVEDMGAELKRLTQKVERHDTFNGEDVVMNYENASSHSRIRGGVKAHSKEAAELEEAESELRHYLENNLAILGFDGETNQLEAIICDFPNIIEGHDIEQGKTPGACSPSTQSLDAGTMFKDIGAGLTGDDMNEYLRLENNRIQWTPLMKEFDNDLKARGMPEPSRNTFVRVVGGKGQGIFMEALREMKVRQAWKMNQMIPLDQVGHFEKNPILAALPVSEMDAIFIAMEQVFVPYMDEHGHLPDEIVEKEIGKYIGPPIRGSRLSETDMIETYSAWAAKNDVVNITRNTSPMDDVTVSSSDHVFGSGWKSNEKDDTDDEEEGDDEEELQEEELQEEELQEDQEDNLGKRPSSSSSSSSRPETESSVTDKSVVKYSDILKLREISDSTRNKENLKQKVRRSKKSLEEKPIGQWRMTLPNHKKLGPILRARITSAKLALQKRSIDVEEKKRQKLNEVQDQFTSMKKVALTDACVSKGLDKKGSKAELQARLREPTKVALIPEVAAALPVLPATQVSSKKAAQVSSKKADATKKLPVIVADKKQYNTKKRG